MAHSLSRTSGSRARTLCVLAAGAVFAAFVGMAGCTGSAGPAVCSTDSAWEGGDGESPLMHPGGDCIGCHTSRGEGPKYTIAGTVMAAADDDTDCNGVEAVTVEITGADGTVLELPTNAAGNFYSSKTVATPFTAKIKKGSAVRAMVAAQSDGNCVTCHTAQGANGAPGRILAP